MSATPQWQDHGWEYFDSVAEAVQHATAAAQEHGSFVTYSGYRSEVLPTVYKVGEEYTYGLTGWDHFRAAIRDWPIVVMWHRQAWRFSLLHEALLDKHIDTL